MTGIAGRLWLACTRYLKRIDYTDGTYWIERNDGELIALWRNHYDEYGVAVYDANGNALDSGIYHLESEQVTADQVMALVYGWATSTPIKEQES